MSYPAPTYYSHLAADRARKYHDQSLEKNMGKERAKEIILIAETKMMYFRIIELSGVIFKIWSFFAIIY